MLNLIDEFVQLLGRLVIFMQYLQMMQLAIWDLILFPYSSDFIATFIFSINSQISLNNATCYTRLRSDFYDLLA